ncbi:lysophospholipid acyltransferase family protein [Granulosicoccus antarcticus]|nr:lysophospholipid acyltransferase family protein [Granulosicoccus antarcticus]
MSVLLIRTLSRALSWLPFHANQSLGATLGRLAWRLNGKLRRITEINIDLCYSQLPEHERRELVRNSLIETGRQLTESAWIWHRPIEQSDEKIVEIRGQNWLDEAQQSGKGCLMVSPHLGNWELCSLPLSRQEPFTYFYRKPRQAGMDKVLLRWRAHLRGQPATLDVSGIKQGLKILKAGGLVGILPDQEPDRNNGHFAPFFNKRTLTMTLLSRLANRSGAVVLFCVVERLPRGKGWIFHIIPADKAVASRDIDEATIALNRGVERCIELCPAQYLWSYKRFNTPEDGARSPYR